jgi:hypothetical protein
MADNFGGGENIFYTDDANIVLIDPNSAKDRSGKRVNRNIKQEDLVMYANLEVESVPRTKLAVGQSVESGVSNFTIASINFLKPQGKNAFDTSYTDQLTGRVSGQGRINQISFDSNSNPQQKNYVDTQLLGIKAISVDILSNGIPTVSMQLTDVQGRALFETGGNSPYSVFLYYPYPLFKLTLKGFYGKAIQYELMLKSFNTSFDQASGNYNIDLQFIARTSAILDDVRLGYLFALPNMYPIYKIPVTTNDNTTQQASASLQQTGTDVSTKTKIDLTSKGYSKLSQVFEEYRTKGLIDKQVPTLTLDAMTQKLKKYTQFLNQQYEQLDFTNVVALEKYSESVARYSTDIEKWKSEFISETNVIALEGGTRLYGLKGIKAITNTGDQTSIASNTGITKTANTGLTKTITINKEEITSVPVWGKNLPTPKKFFEQIQFTKKFTSDDINFLETYFLRTGNRVTRPKTDEDFKNFKDTLIKELYAFGTFVDDKNATSEGTDEPSPYYYTTNLFEKNVADLNQLIAKTNQQENEKLNEEFQNRIKVNGLSSDLTFRPTIRNVVGVIMASVDAFYRTMDDVHDLAWRERNNKDRINSIIKTNTPSQDGKSSVPTAGKNITDVIYPWPQFVQKKDVAGTTEYQLSYPGSRSVVGFTKGYDTRIWPEVDFVEQFLYALTVKETEFNSTTHNTTDITLNYTPSSAIEFKFVDDIYKSTPNAAATTGGDGTTGTTIFEFVYEMYERLLLNTFYSGMYFNDIDKDSWTTIDLTFAGSNLEVNNIINSYLPNGDLKSILKTEVNTKPLYDYLKSTAGPNEEGPKWRNFLEQNYNTSYINEHINNSTELLSENAYGKFSRIPTKLESLDKITSYLNDNSSTRITLFDTYPFSISTFRDKMEDSNATTTRGLYQTISTYTLDQGNLFITNQKNTIQPFTKSSSTVIGFTGDVNKSTVNDFYNRRFAKGSERMLTEGRIYGDDTNINANTTTSMLNTPYFMNALLMEGDNTTYERSAYLFLNSLPLSTLYEKYLNTTSSKKEDYIFSSFSKFSAVHKLPYAWILKIGSVYYRYKKYVNGDGDILEDVWKDFDYVKAYDPTTNNENRVYQIITDNATNKTPYSITPIGGGSINTGFYPGLYNSVYKIITGTDLFNNNVDSKPDIFWGENLKVITNFNVVTNNSLFGPLVPYHSYFNITAPYGKVFGSEEVGKSLLFPSAGYLPFLQSYIVNKSSGDVNYDFVNSPQMFNGSARAFWSAPNFGWFDNSIIQKPNYDEYLKFIDNNTDNQSEFGLYSTNRTNNNPYAKIEDLFGVFTKEQLDLFEQEFIGFSTRGGVSQLFIESDTAETGYSNFQQILKKMLLVTPPSEKNPEGFASSQVSAISNTISKFLELSVYLKIGNPTQFDRVQFGNFITGTDEQVNKMKPNVSEVYGTYVLGSLPDSVSTLEESQTNYPEEWKALKLHVGFSTIPNIQYTEVSYIYDFFIENNIAFTVPNIQKLHKLIKIYATRKVKLPSYEPQDFREEITKLIKDTYEKRTNIENQLRTKLPNAINQGPKSDEVAISKFEGDSTKLEMWEVFKALNDKWVAGIDFSTRSLFEEFLFFDKSNRDIGDDFIINVDSIIKYCSWSNSNTSVMSLLRQLFAENRMNFFVLPAYINFYGKPYLNSTTRNQTILNNANDVFSTFGYVDYISSSPKFLCQYIGKPSETLSMDNDPKYPFKSDSFDMGVSAGNTLKNTNPVTNQFRNNKAVGFVVDFGVPNQNVFKSVEISQNQNVTSSEQIQTIVDMGQLGGNKKTSQQTVSLFELYKNRTYDCTVKTLGNVMIQPTMYFVLRHLPMFNGTYIIRNVKHEIGPGVFNTTIKGQRMSSLSVPKVYDELASINEDFTKKLQNTVKTKSANNTVVTRDSESRKYLEGQAAIDYQIKQRVPYQGFIINYENSTAEPLETNLWGSPESDQSKLSKQPYTTKTITLNNLVINLKQNVSDKEMRLFLFTLFFLSGYNTEKATFKIQLNNLYGITGDIQWSKSLLQYVSGYRQLDNKGTLVPIFDFVRIGTCLDFMKNYFANLLNSQIECTKKEGYNAINIEDINGENFKCTAESFVTLFYKYWYAPNVTDIKKDPNFTEYYTVAERALTLANTEKLLI